MGQSLRPQKRSILVFKEIRMKRLTILLLLASVANADTVVPSCTWGSIKCLGSQLPDHTMPHITLRIIQPKAHTHNGQAGVLMSQTIAEVAYSVHTLEGAPLTHANFNKNAPYFIECYWNWSDPVNVPAIQENVKHRGSNHKIYPWGTWYPHIDVDQTASEENPNSNIECVVIP